MCNQILCGSQVLISHGETKDGSGGPLGFEDSESGDVVLNRDRPEPTEQQAIAVRHWTDCGAFCGSCTLLHGES